MTKYKVKDIEERKQMQNKQKTKHKKPLAKSSGFYLCFKFIFFVTKKLCIFIKTHIFAVTALL